MRVTPGFQGNQKFGRFHCHLLVNRWPSHFVQRHYNGVDVFKHQITIFARFDCSSNFKYFLWKFVLFSNAQNYAHVGCREFIFKVGEGHPEIQLS